ncbi:hypothetical protein J4221_00370 [Candidatus Pacearchaeota archaeon]|nr:hypothetical protein [Candidatus Pacearchaeota archaeon]
MKKSQTAPAIALLIIVIILIGLLIIFLVANLSGFSIKYSDEKKEENINYPDENLILKIDYDKTDEILCSYPYMRYGSGCCLDKNINYICDNDELSVKEITYNFCEYPYVKIGNKCCYDNNRNGICDDKDDYRDRDRDINEDAYLGSPFSVSDFDINSDEITLWIKNRGDKTVRIGMIEIEDCDDFDEDVILEKNEKERFDFDCDRDNRFSRDIRVTYSEEGSDKEKTARGNIERDYD